MTMVWTLHMPVNSRISPRPRLLTLAVTVTDLLGSSNSWCTCTCPKMHTVSSSVVVQTGFVWKVGRHLQWMCVFASLPFGCVCLSHWCQGYICGEWCRWELRVLEGAANAWEREGGGQRCTEEECRLFPCVWRTGELSWLQAGAVSP